MNIFRTATLVLAMIVVFGCQELRASPPISGDSTITVEKDEDAFISRLRPVLLAARNAGRISFLATCTSRNGHLLFPAIDVFTSSGPTSNAADAIRKMLRANNDVKVTQSDHIVRIQIGNAPKTVLRTKMLLLKLTPDAQYDPVLAIAAIESTSEVEGVQKRYGLTTPDVAIAGFVNPPDKRMPHLPPVLRDLTVDQALDLVAKTFGQVISYGHCLRERRYYVKGFDIDTDDDDTNPTDDKATK